MSDRGAIPEAIILEKVVAQGIDLEVWNQSFVGQYVHARAEKERAAALEALVAVDPEDAKSVRTLQNRIYVIDSIGYWLAEAMTAAEDAKARLDQLAQGD